MSDEQTNLTLRQRKRLQQSDGDAGDSSEPKSKRRFLLALLAVGLVLLVGVGGAWAWLHFNRGDDPRYLEFLALQEKANKLENPMSPEAFDLYKKMHETMKDLPDDLKKKAEQDGRGAMQARINRFFTMSSADQLAMLDKVIFGIQAMEAMHNMQTAIAGKPADSSADAGKNGGGPGGHGGPWGGTDTQKVEFRQKMLSNMSPQQRAQWGMGRQMMNARMQQQGSTPPAGGIF